MNHTHISRWRSAILLALVAWLAACSRSSDNGYQGYVEGEYLYLAAPLAGYLDTLHTPRGSRVVSGAPVFSIAADTEQHGLQAAEALARAADEQLRNLSTPRRQSEIATLQAQLRVAEAALHLSDRQLQQQESLAAKGFISASQLDAARAARARDAAQVEAAREQLATARATLGRAPEVNAAQAQAQAAQADVAQKRWQVEKKIVTAPNNGEIADTFYRPGEWVPAGQPVASLLPDGLRRIRFFVPETVVARIQLGQVVQATCDGCAQPIRATVNFISPQAEYTPPVIYSRGSREKLVFRIEAVPAAEQAATLHPGLPVDVKLLEQKAP
ncbi:MAG: HlyD family efflux transporter periplasmic adaptor subunit [Burkholderiaceae bacterium]|nr:MAG: HlyD family efflux transporter periplasmic adaptor subunit [Burkholderiaceae bacterium]